jgi:hypothetical protein
MTPFCTTGLIEDKKGRLLASSFWSAGLSRGRNWSSIVVAAYGCSSDRKKAAGGKNHHPDSHSSEPLKPKNRVP